MLVQFVISTNDDHDHVDSDTDDDDADDEALFLCHLYTSPLILASSHSSDLIHSFHTIHSTLPLQSPFKSFPNPPAHPNPITISVAHEPPDGI